MTASSPVLLKPSVRFPEVILAKNQPEYEPLPVLISNDISKMITARFRLTWKERLAVLFGGNIWVQQLTFNHNLPPVKLHAKELPIHECL